MAWEIDITKKPYRKGYEEMKKFILRFNDRPTIPLAELRTTIPNYTDIMRPLVIWDLLELTDEDSVRITSKGRDFINTFDSEYEKEYFGNVLIQDPDFRYKWAMLCDNKKMIKTNEAYPIFLEGDMDKGTAILYAQKFINWAKHGGYCRGGRAKYQILKRIIVGKGPNGGVIENHISPKPTKIQVNYFENTLYKFSTLIADLSYGYEVEYSEMKNLFEKIMKSDEMDGVFLFPIQALFDSICNESSSNEIKQAMGVVLYKSVKKLREEFEEAIG